MQNNKFVFVIMLVVLILVLVSCTNDSSDSNLLYVNSEFNYSFEVPSTFLSIDPGFNDVIFSSDLGNETLLTAFSGALDQGTTFGGTYDVLKRELPYKLGAKIDSDKSITVNGNQARRLELSYVLAEKDYKYILVLIKTPNNRFLGISLIEPKEDYSSLNTILDNVLKTLKFDLLVVGKRI